jgi:threonine/homoserine/homoserine lactone efflux protein
MQVPDGATVRNVPPADRLLAFLIATTVLILIPGPSVLFTIGRALTIGRAGALRSVAGNALGSFVQVVAVAIGVGALVARSAELYAAIKYAGAAYLVYLGIQAFRHRGDLTASVAATPRVRSARRQLLDGFVVGVSNPKTIVFFTVVLPQFTDPHRGQVPLQLFALGVLFPLIAVVFDSVWALAAATAREWLARSPRRIAAVGGAGGIAIATLGVSVAVTGRRD